MSTAANPAGPRDPAYLDERDFRAELERVFDICHGCRLCFNLCPSFPTLFELVDEHDGRVGALNAAEQDRVVDECYQCKLCALKCPYVPPHEWALDFPQLMQRAQAVRAANGRPLRDRVADQVLGRTDLVGAVSSTFAPAVNGVMRRTGSVARKLLERSTGVAAERLLPPYARQRFTSWFAGRSRAARRPEGESIQGEVAVFPTCFVEYMAPAIGKDLVGVLEHNRVVPSVPDGLRCCGAPWLHAGNLAAFERAATRNVAVLAGSVRAGREVVVPQPTCAYVLRKDYPLHLAGTAHGEDAALVAAHCVDPAEYLLALDRGEESTLEKDTPGVASGTVPDRVTYHVACHLQAQQVGLKSRDVLKRLGIRADLVQRCSGIDGTWGYRATNYELARKVAAPLAREIEQAGNAVVCGDCHLANGAIEQETGRHPVHPVQLLARAYGLPEEPDR
jgi:glycerol-3-phosphate dehydrogenase subunit C